ncbi:MAG: hypothetical protein RIT27_2302 [Pseudomonadota bacterium]|jgi:general secretion pathway protein G
MQTLVIYHQDKGFTLLELLIVLLVLGLITGLALPRMSAIYEGMVISYQKDDILSQLNGLHFKTFQQGENFDLTVYPLPSTAPKLLELPEGWKLQTQQPIRFRSNGACAGGHLTLFHGEEQFVIKLEPPFCSAKLL